MQTISPTKLRQNIYKILDQLAKKGESIAIERKGEIFTLNPPRKKSKLDALRKKRNLIKGDPADLVNISWEHEWNPDPL